MKYIGHYSKVSKTVGSSYFDPRRRITPSSAVTAQGSGASLASSPWCNLALLRGVVYIRDSDDSEAV